jgi:peptide/nickel transport system permease protein
MRIGDIVLAFPSLILAMAVAAALGPSTQNSILALLIVRWPPYARLSAPRFWLSKRGGVRDHR